MDKPMIRVVTAGRSASGQRTAVGPVNGSIRLPNGDSFRYVRSDILREAIDQVTHRDTRKAK